MALFASPKDDDRGEADCGGNLSGPYLGGGPIHHGLQPRAVWTAGRNRCRSWTHYRESTMAIAALIVAAGRGTRAAERVPKQYAPLGSAPMLARTLRVFLEHPAVDLALVVIAEADRVLYE